MFIGSPYNIYYYMGVLRKLYGRQNKNDDKAFSRLPFYCRHWHSPPPPPKHTHPSDGYRYYPIEQIFTIRHNNNNNIYTYTIYNRSENVIYL